MEVTYQMAFEQMLPAYRKWDKAGSRYDETVAKYPDNRDRIEQATRREKRAWDILYAQISIIGRLFGRDRSEVFDGVEELYRRVGDD